MLREDGIQERAARWAATIAGTLDAATYLACPAIARHMGTSLGADFLAAHLSAYIAVAEEIEHASSLSESSQSIVDAAREAGQLRALVLAMESLEPPFPAQIVDSARAFLKAFGYGEPPAGWDGVVLAPTPEGS